MLNQRSEQNQRDQQVEQKQSAVFLLVVTKLCLFVSSILFASIVFSASEPLGYTLQDLLSAEEQQLTLKSRNREYPLGALEESLKVQVKVVATSTVEEDEAATESSEDRD